MSKIVFIQFGDTRQLELKIDGGSTWMDVTEEFVLFLQGCGYQVTGADVADYLSEVHGEVDCGFDFATANEQYNQDTMATENVTLDDVMNMWGQSARVAQDPNTITITTR